MSLSQPHSWRALEISADRLLATDRLSMAIHIGVSLDMLQCKRPLTLGRSGMATRHAAGCDVYSLILVPIYESGGVLQHPGNT